jgi:hypothetical protein
MWAMHAVIAKNEHGMRICIKIWTVVRYVLWSPGLWRRAVKRFGRINCFKLWNTGSYLLHCATSCRQQPSQSSPWEPEISHSRECVRKRWWEEYFNVRGRKQHEVWARYIMRNLIILWFIKYNEGNQTQGKQGWQYSYNITPRCVRAATVAKKKQ